MSGPDTRNLEVPGATRPFPGNDMVLQALTAIARAWCAGSGWSVRRRRCSRKIKEADGGKAPFRVPHVGVALWLGAGLTGQS